MARERIGRLCKKAHSINRLEITSEILRCSLTIPYEVPVLKTAIGQRVAFAEAATTGSTVLEQEPQSLAAQEIEALVREIVEG